MSSAFARFPARLQEAIVARLGWSSLRPVQELASHAILDGKNAVILAPTAGGKTEASMFPSLAQLVEKEPQGVGLIYIAPIKALLNNQAERLGLYTEMVELRRFLWHGDVKNSAKKAFMKEPSALLMTTPESLEVMLLSSKFPHQKLFGDLRSIVVDEVHALAGSDRGTHLLSVIERLACYTDNDIQRIGLSATVGNPDEILRWLQGTSKREGCIVNPPKVPSKKDIHIYLQDTLGAIAHQASQTAQDKKSLFFCQSRALAEDIAERMRGRGTDVFVHHSSVSLEERTAAEERFYRGSNTSIVCTSTLELGIDVGDLDLVFQANAPSTVSSFLQRLGRTGRRSGQHANTTFFCENIETVLQAIAIVELARKGWVESVPCQTRVWPVMVHQLFALTLQFGAISSERCWEQLSHVPDFSGITYDEFEILIKHLIDENYLFLSGG
ncbi:MAG: DEAD/DEAH box helicase, partial [Cyanobacteria bacterium CAN_BIN43]|nr:DEAD/DEAH box helicase [Cyanobacteria bacterium CAN_BIN43]